MSEDWEELFRQSEAVRERQSEILRKTANALKGDPPPRVRHDLSDLPKVAALLRPPEPPPDHILADIVRDELGDWVYWPKGHGAYAAHHLRQIAAEIDRRVAAEPTE